MSVIGDLLSAVRQVLTLEHRVALLTDEIATFKMREENTRERLIRLEGIIEGAMRVSRPALPPE